MGEASKTWSLGRGTMAWTDSSQSSDRLFCGEMEGDLPHGDPSSSSVGLTGSFCPDLQDDLAPMLSSYML